MDKFIFGGDTGMSYEELQRRRAIAAQMMKSSGAPRNVGEGIHSAAKSIAGALMDRKARKAMEKGQAEFNDQFAQVAPNYQGMVDLANSPYATKAHSKVIEALMKGVPNYQQGTPFHPGGPAVVGERGPEVVQLPFGAQVQPAQSPLQFGVLDPDDSEYLFELPEPLRNEAMQRIEGGEPSRGVIDEMMQRLQPGLDQYDPASQQRLLQEGELPMSPEFDTREFIDRQSTLQPQGSFDDARAVQVADSGNILSDIPKQPILGDDSVSRRAAATKEVDYRNALSGLGGILDQLQANPELIDSTHTISGRMKSNFQRLRDRSGIEAFDIGPEEEKALGDTTAYRQELLTRVNNYIKEVTGATVGQGDETKRLMAVQANEDDSPTQVIAKITNAMNIARLEVARNFYMQRTGGEAPSDAELRDMLKQRGAEHYQAAISQGMSPNDARIQAAQMLSEEMGW